MKSFLADTNYDITDFNYRQDKKSLPIVHEELKIVANNYASVSGKRIFIVPNLLNKSHLRLLPDTARQFDIALDDEYTNVDSVEITIPAGYNAEQILKEEAYITKFGSYWVTAKLALNKILYYRKIERYSGRFPAKDFADLIKFNDLVYKSDRNRIVLVKTME